jgi:hypothetical protein
MVAALSDRPSIRPYVLKQQHVDFSFVVSAEVLNVSVEVLVERIVVATIDGFLYTEKIPDHYP